MSVSSRCASMKRSYLSRLIFAIKPGKIDAMWKSGAYGYLLDYLLWWLALATLVLHTWCFFKLFPKERHRRARLVLGNILVTLCLLAVAGAVGETYFRFLVVETDTFGISLASKRWLKLYPKLNAMYFRDVEWSLAKPVGTRRIAFIGDSFTYGWGVNDSRDRFTEVLQERMKATSARPVEIMNMGWFAWDTGAELRAIPDLIEQYSLDEIVLCYVPNDIETLLPVSAESNPMQPPRSVYVNTEASFLFDYLYYRWLARQTPAVRTYCDWLADGYFDLAVWRSHVQRLEQIIKQCRERNVMLRVALLPFLKTWGTRYDAQRIHTQLREAFERNGVPVVDLLPVVTANGQVELVVNDHDPHPNEVAHRLFADGIWKAFYDR